MKKITVPENTNYMSIFLTWKCPMGCTYCINKSSGFVGCEQQLTGKEWIKIINRIPHSDLLPLTLSGGEPTSHPDFYEIMQGAEGPFDLLTNGQFDIGEFIDKTSPDMFRKTPGKETGIWFNSVRVSYHSRDWDIDNQLAYENKVIYALEQLQGAGYKAGFTCPDHPGFQEQIAKFEAKAKKLGIPFQRKSYLGWYEGKMYGTYKYPAALSRKPQSCDCKTTEILMAPDGFMYRCHSDLYNRDNAIGHALMENIEIEHKFRPCGKFGLCSPCDPKMKTDRFGKGDHCAIEVQNFKHDFTPSAGWSQESTCSMSVRG